MQLATLVRPSAVRRNSCKELVEFIFPSLGESPFCCLEHSFLLFFSASCQAKRSLCRNSSVFASTMFSYRQAVPCHRDPGGHSLERKTWLPHLGQTSRHGLRSARHLPQNLGASISRSGIADPQREHDSMASSVYAPQFGQAITAPSPIGGKG